MLSKKLIVAIYFCSISHFVTGCCKACDRLKREIQELKDARQYSVEQLTEVNRMLADMETGSDIAKRKLELLANRVDGLSDFSGLDKGDSILNQWKDIAKLSDKQLTAMSDIIRGNMSSEIEKLRKAQRVEELKQQLDTYRSAMGRSIEGVVGNVSIMISNASSMVRMATEIGTRVEVMLGGKVEEISRQQKQELVRMQTMTDDRLAAIDLLTQQIQSKIGNQQQVADRLFNLSSSLSEQLLSTLDAISNAMSMTINDQLRIELVMKFSRAINRINYLFDWRERLDRKSDANTVAENTRWARAVIFGEPADRPIEELIDDMIELSTGRNPHPQDYELLGSRGSTLLDIYHNKIKMSADKEQNPELITIEQKRQFLSENGNLTETYQSKMMQSEAFMVLSLGGTVERIQMRAFEMATKANGILTQQVTTGRRTKREAVVQRTSPDGRTSFKYTARYVEISNIIGEMIYAGDSQRTALLSKADNSKTTVRVNIPVLQNGSMLPVDPDFFVIANSTRVHYIALTPVDRAASGSQLVGCRFCDKMKCQRELQTTLATNFFYLQCAYKPKLMVALASTLTVLPNRVLDLDVKSFEQTPGANNGIVIGLNRVPNPASQYVCGARFGKFINMNMYPLGIEITVCSRSDGSIVSRTKAPPTNSTVLRVDNLRLFSSLWVRQAGGWTTGIGFYVTRHDNGESILNVEIETSYY